MDGLCECGKPVYAKGMCKNCYYKVWHKKNPGKYNEKKYEWANKHPEKVKEITARYYRKTHPTKPKENAVCKIIKQHHEAMKDDPEHLPTEFIKKLIKVDCKEV